MRVPRPTTVAAILAGLASGTFTAEARSEDRTPFTRRPNIVWVIAEDMNAWMGSYGDDTVPTPNIDRLATRGIRFDRVFSQRGKRTWSGTLYALSEKRRLRHVWHWDSA